jgi:hypothetical protein
MYRFDAVKRNTISRGPVVDANLDLLAEAVDGIQAFRTRLSRELLETASFEDMLATDAGGGGHEAGEKKSIRQHTSSAYVSIRQQVVGTRQVRTGGSSLRATSCVSVFVLLY